MIIFITGVECDMDWKSRLDSSMKDRRSLLCIGLDTDMGRFPPDIKENENAQFLINREIVRATADIAAAYKPNLAFYEVEGEKGLRALKDTVMMVREEAPHAITILDAKKGDIGNTSNAYARAAFEMLQADGVTVNPYMGLDAVYPFSKYTDKLVFVLCRTSNKAAPEVQDLTVEGEPFYLRMARTIRGWNQGGNLGVVVGATYPDELGLVREVIGNDMPILIPGIGAQGGNLREVLEKGTNEAGGGVLINISRGIMFAFQQKGEEGTGFAEAAKASAREYYKTILETMESLGRW